MRAGKESGDYVAEHNRLLKPLEENGDKCTENKNEC